VPAVRGPITFSADGETWIEYADGDNRRRVGFHDYAAIYAVPGLYERVFYEELGMCSSTRVVAVWSRVLAELGRDPGAERILDLGAGNGIGGAALRDAGAGALVGLDLEPAARAAAQRDRPGVYDDYRVGDLLTLAADDLAALRERRFTSVLALAAIGVGHILPEALEVALGLLEPGGLFAFAVTPALLPGSEDPDGVATGYPDYLAGLLSGGEELAREEYVHRRQTDGTPHDAVAIAGRRG
jgi:SAM-dependent methyltransferase